MRSYKFDIMKFVVMLAVVIFMTVTDALGIRFNGSAVFTGFMLLLLFLCL